MNEKTNSQHQPLVYRVERSDRKSYGLKVTEKAEIIVKAPWYAGKRDIERIVGEKEKWLRDKLRLMENRKSQKPIRDFKEGTELFYLGDLMTLKIDESISRDIKIVFPHIHLASDLTQNAKSNLEIWYRHHAMQLFSKHAEEIAKLHGLSYKNIKLSSAKKRWGSCSSSGNINLSWRLMMAPERIVHYVIAHELAHTVHMDHSRDFWALVEHIHPHSKHDDKWLDENGHKLDW